MRVADFSWLFPASNAKKKALKHTAPYMRSLNAKEGISKTDNTEKITKGK